MAAVFLALLAALAASDPMQWTDRESGAIYDWSILQRPVEYRSYSSPWRVSAPNSDVIITTVYEFNIGRNLAQGCLLEPVTAVERLMFLNDTFEECAIIGRHEMRQVELLDVKDPEQGVVVTYTGGRMCSSLTEDFINARKQISLRLLCAETQDENFSLIDSLNEYDVLECHAYLQIRSPAGCPRRYEVRMSKNTLLALMCRIRRFVFCLLLYCGIAWLVKLEETDDCMQAMPHKDFLRRVATKGCSFISSCYRSSPPLRKRDNYESV